LKRCVSHVVKGGKWGT